MRISVQPQSGKSLLAILRQESVVSVAAPCGGRGRCGKCKVTVVEGEIAEPTEEESRFLTPADLEAGRRVSCLVYPKGEVVVEVPAALEAMSQKADQFGDGAPIVDAPAPEVFVDRVELSPPHKDDQAADWERLRSAEGVGRLVAERRVLAELPSALRAGGFDATLVRDADRCYGVLPEMPSGQFGIAIDVGTTTLAAYLVDVQSGTVVDVVSALNAQQKFGADVISRIHHTMEHEEGAEELRNTIVTQLDDICGRLAERGKINPSEVVLVHITGNTTMMHLAAGLPAQNIAAAPFIPTTTDSIVESAWNLGLTSLPHAKARLLPAVSGYVGADIVAAILSAGVHHKDTTALLIDIGTNGEIVLKHHGVIYCCSTAAGPAFEGAQIHDGVGGIRGAVNAIHFDGDKPEYTTIADEAPLGICGSGITDALAILLRVGVVDETGRMLGPPDSGDLQAALASRLQEVDGEPAFMLVPAEETSTGSPVVMTQKDVREIQLAKAAIAAGIETLIQEAGIAVDEVEALYLAGGFGSYLRKESAVAIGLLPSELGGRITVLGNAAGKGAVLTLLSEAMTADALGVADDTVYVELSSSAAFQMAYISQMAFPE